MRHNASRPLYDDDAISRRIFFPTWGRRLPPVRSASRISVQLDEGCEIGALWVCPHARAPTLLLFHGNGESIADQLYSWPAWTAELGLNALFVDYPGYSTSSGRPHLSLTRQACWQALQFLLRKPRSRVPAVLLMGRSLGSLFALDCAARCRSRRLRGLILESAIADVAAWLVATLDTAQLGLDIHRLRAELRRDWNQRAKLHKLRCPLLVLHCHDDELLPVDNARRLARWAPAGQTQLTIFERGGHNGIRAYNRDAYPRALADFCSYLDLQT